MPNRGLHTADADATQLDSCIASAVYAYIFFAERPLHESMDAACALKKTRLGRKSCIIIYLKVGEEI